MSARAPAVNQPDSTTSSRRAFLQRLFRTRAEDTLPIKVEHQRIYILPTRRGCAFLAVLLLMLIGSVNYSLSLGYALSFLLTGLFAATLLHTYRNLAGLELSRIATETAFLGEPLDFHLSFDNSRSEPRQGLTVSARSFGTTAQNVQQSTALFAIPAADTQTVTLSMPTSARGYQPLGRLTLESDWPLGLWNAWSYVHAPTKGLVFPPPESDPPPLPTAMVQANGQARRAGLQGDVAGLRDYVPGDAISSVAWKSAARGQGLHVRLFDDERGSSSAHLDLAGTRLADREAQLSRLVAWVLKAESCNTDYSVDLPGTSLPLERGRSHELAALTACALFGKAS